MDAFPLKKSGFYLFAIAVLALLVRLPGLFWGFNSFTIPSFTLYHIDELHLANIAQRILGEMDPIKVRENRPKYAGTQKLVSTGLALFRQYAVQEKCPPAVVHGADIALFISKHIHSGVAVRKSNYPMGYPYQVAGLASLFHYKNETPLIVIGRAVSVFYSVMTVVLIFFLSRELFSNSLVALSAGAFLALSGLHVTQSHYATVDSGNTFWIYATVYFSLLSLRREKMIYFILALLSGGIGLTLKLAWVTLIPLFYILRRQKRAGFSRLLMAVCLVFFFMLAIGSFNNIYNFVFILHNVLKNNVVNNGTHNKFLNPFIYFAQLFTGAGLLVSLLFLYGCWRLFRQRRLFENIFNKDVFVILFLPLLIHLISICFIRYHYCRHTLPLIPLITIVAAFGFMEATKTTILSNSRPKTCFLFSFILIYQLIYVGSTEYYFFYDTREDAAKWIVENVPPGAALTYEGCPALYDYNIDLSYNTPYIIVTFPRYRFDNIRNLFEGSSRYTLIKKFEMKNFTPELFLYKKFLGNYTNVIADTFIFKSNETASKNI